MNALKGVVIGMGVLILAMMALMAIGLSRRANAPPTAPSALAANVTLNEPAGTHIASISAAGPQWAVLLQGGGPDRVILLAPDGRIAGRISLQK